MVSFQSRLAQGLTERGVEVSTDLNDSPYEAILVIGGTRQLTGLWRAKRKGIRIVQRLDGMNWLHRLRKTGIRHFLRAEYGNLLLTVIRQRIANRIVYQSEFSKEWWERARGPTPIPNSVVHNGVDLAMYSPTGAGQRPENRYRILMVEGSLMGGYEMGLEVGLKLAERLNDAHSHISGREVELMIVGRVDPSTKARWDRRAQVQLTWSGTVHADQIPSIDRSAHILFSADLNPACPNSVIEALACGLPVLAFDTGALSELVSEEAGRIVPYGGDPWKLAPPDVEALSIAGLEILTDQQRFRIGARAQAETAFGLERMVTSYLQALL